MASALDSARAEAALEESWQPVWVIMRRELRDSLRDWRIITPIFGLTLGFPVLMNFTAQYLLDFVVRFGAQNSLLAERMIPFLLMIVGFFPISFSLVIALETFVGEKERRSLEALLVTPLTDLQLYLGKMLGAMLPPLMASYAGMLLYLLGLYGGIRWTASLELLVLIFILTTLQAVVMVCGAVVVSSQVTSVRASNLLASFIIIPMALLIQVESALMFWADYKPLWGIAAGLLVVAVILARMGVSLFNREELLGRELDELNFRWAARQFTRNWFENVPLHLRWNPFAWYRYSVGATLKRLGLPAGVVGLAALAAFGIGSAYASLFPLPAIPIADVTGALPDAFVALGPGFFIGQNLRVLLGAGLFGIFSFGALAVVLVMAPFMVIGYATGQFALQGHNPLVFLAAFVLPHGIAEIPAALLAGAAALRLGATLIAPPPGRQLGDVWLQALTDFVKILVAVSLPLLVVAALLEVYVTPQVVVSVYGR